MDAVEEAVEDTLGQLRDKDDPASFLHGQPTFEAMLHLVAALGLWRLDDLDTSVEHLRRAHAMASSSTNPRHRTRYKDVMRRARSMAGLPDYPALEEFPMDENCTSSPPSSPRIVLALADQKPLAPRWGYPPQMVIDEDGETRLVMPESNRWPAFEASQAARGTGEVRGLAGARGLASDTQEIPSSPGEHGSARPPQHTLDLTL